MLYDKSLEKDNCGFDLIATEGEPSHKVVRPPPYTRWPDAAPWRVLADGKTGDGCGLLLQNLTVSFASWPKGAAGSSQKLRRRDDLFE